MRRTALVQAKAKVGDPKQKGAAKDSDVKPKVAKGKVVAKPEKLDEAAAEKATAKALLLEGTEVRHMTRVLSRWQLPLAQLCQSRDRG